jgi:hypothetical protein
MEMKLAARIRKVLEAIDAEIPGGDPRDVTMTQQLELLIAAGAAPYSEIVRTGRAFWTGTTTAVAAVVALPTTAVMLALYNNAADGGRSLIIDWIAASGVAKTAAAGQQQMLGLIGQLRETAPTDAGLSFKKMNGLGGIKVDSMALTIVGGTALPATTGIAANWFPIGPSFGSPGAAATPGDGAHQNTDGRIIVAPGRYFAMHVLADVVGSTYQGFIGWHEKQLNLS